MMFNGRYGGVESATQLNVHTKQLPDIGILRIMENCVLGVYYLNFKTQLWPMAQRQLICTHGWIPVVNYLV